ncbi:GNAT family N-acetyltransferase [Paucibacter sp. APW11]|uniref:GNAT family N-acetyltransferase n=1 Tax=Roseateles aquae TaxID=3077235 RepID=A0ABU3P699_9BURK|nr:GNAT family N-acetyltransferase [Paucibacter sp. APW11]MDT8998105.1 GNAT family N-acetyltransferase [Paucibacter sp. APW11]
MFELRPLLEADLDAVLAIQSACYQPGFHESRQAFAAKLQATPQGCWLAVGKCGSECDVEALAYVFSVAVDAGQLPALDAQQISVPRQAEWLYLHDMAVAPVARTLGVAAALLARLEQVAAAQQLSSIVLIAVQASLPFWQRQGFAELQPLTPLLAAKLASYGPQARLLWRPLPSR